MIFRVASINESGVDRVTVILVEESSMPGVPVPYGAPAGSSNINLNLSTKEAANYFPGKLYNINIKAA